MSNERTCAIGRELILPSGKLHRDEERAGVYAAVTRVEAGHQPLREVELPGFRRRLDDGLRGPPDHRHAVCIGGRFLRDDWLDRVNGHRQHASAGRRREATRIVRRLRRDDAYKENGGGNQEPQSAPPAETRAPFAGASQVELTAIPVSAIQSCAVEARVISDRLRWPCGWDVRR
jgi:hypothetical protein